MMCEHVRVALSARLDGEDPPAPAAEIDAHLSICASCQEWQARAEDLSTALRAVPAPAPDLTATVLAAVAADERRRAEPAGRRQVLRVTVAVLAAAQLVSALSILFGAEAGFGAHATREMACFDVALAVGFALAAYRPERARALVPVALVLALCLALTSAVDVAGARTAVVHEIGHLAALVQAAALWALGRHNGAPLTPVSAGGRG